MRTVSFIGRKLSVNQRQSMERMRTVEQSSLPAKEAFKEGINQTIASIEEKLQILEDMENNAFTAEQLEDYFKYRFDKELSFDNRASYSLAHDDNFIDHTRGKH